MTTENVNLAGSALCVLDSGVAIQNCEFDYINGQSKNCYSCKASYAVTSTGTTCTSYTNDGNCRTLHTDGNCNYCYHAYYWDTTYCTLKSLIVNRYIRD